MCLCPSSLRLSRQARAAETFPKSMLLIAPTTTPPSSFTAEAVSVALRPSKRQRRVVGRSEYACYPQRQSRRHSAGKSYACASLPVALRTASEITKALGLIGKLRRSRGVKTTTRWWRDRIRTSVTQQQSVRIVDDWQQDGTMKIQVAQTSELGPCALRQDVMLAHYICCAAHGLKDKGTTRAPLLTLLSLIQRAILGSCPNAAMRIGGTDSLRPRKAPESAAAASPGTDS